MNMVEKVARAIATAGNEDPDEKVGSLLNPDKVIWQDYEAQARAAIEAMRELTPEMTQVGKKQA